MDKILRINMGPAGAPTSAKEDLGAFAGLGGRAMTTAIVAKEVPPLCHALSAENKLIIAPGLLSGTTAAMSGRLSIGCKSPLTGTIKESNAGGQAAQVLARLGYAAIVIEGAPKDDSLYKIVINKDGVQISAAPELKLLGNYDVVDQLIGTYGAKAAIISIGLSHQVVGEFVHGRREMLDLFFARGRLEGRCFAVLERVRLAEQRSQRPPRERSTQGERIVGPCRIQALGRVVVEERNQAQLASAGLPELLDDGSSPRVQRGLG